MKYEWENTGIGKVDHLGVQFAKVMRGCNQGSIKTRYRYAAAGKRFTIFVAQKFNLAKIQNIQDKHLEEYTNKMKDEGKSDKYIKTELSAIRYIQRQIPQAKYKLTDGLTHNKEMNLGSTPDGRADRAWSESEIKAMKDKAIELNRPEVANIIEVMRAMGIRLNEAATLKRDQTEKAMRTGQLYLTNTKGGRPRTIPLNERARELFQKVMPDVPRGAYVFTPVKYVVEHKIHDFKASVEDFISNHRDKIQDQDRNSSGHNLEPGEKGALTAHGLRHSYARDEYKGLRDCGWSKKDAEKEIAERLGHGRSEVTKIYTLD